MIVCRLMLIIMFVVEGRSVGSSVLHLKYSFFSIIFLPVIAAFPVRTLIRKLLSECLVHVERVVYVGESAFGGLAGIGLILLW